LLNPQHLILFEDTHNLLKNKWVMQLLQALADAMNNGWKNLVSK
jgi:hypothetical protein